MSYYQKSSYRPNGDSYRPNQKTDNPGFGGAAQASPQNDRNAASSYRPHQANSRPSNQGSSYVPGARQTPSRYPDRGSHSNPPNAYNRHNNAGQHSQNRYPKQSSSHGSGQGQDYGAKYAPRGQQNSYHQVYSQTQAETQLWMGDLDPRWTESDISSIWASVGETPTGVKIMRDKGGKPQYCFVTFADSTAVASALKKNKLPIPGSQRTFKLNWASGGSQSQGDSRQVPGSSRGAPSRQATDFSVFVGDIAPDATEALIFAKFDKEYPGAVKQVKIMVDANTGASKGFGFVRFHTLDAQQAALKEMSGTVICKRPIRVGPANGGNSEAVPTRKDGTPAVKLAQSQPSLTPFTDPHNSVISVRGISPAVTREEIIAHFLPFGHIVFCAVDESSAEIKYLHRESAEKALLFMDGFTINGCRVSLRWSREMVDLEGETRFKPGHKGAKYSAAEQPPQIYGQMIENVVFEDLSAADLRSLETIDPSVNLTISQIDENTVKLLQSREAYLSSAY